MSDKWADRWPDFKIEEILSPDQLSLFNRKGVFPYSFRALDKLQAFRRFVDKPFLINHMGLQRRGSRSMREVFSINSDTRGKDRAWEYSFHLWCAFDISVDGLSPMELFEKAIGFGQWGGVGLYNSFVHCDDRDHFGPVAHWDARYSKNKDAE